MKGKAYVINIAGGIDVHELKATPTLEQLKEWIGGGYIELVPLWNKHEKKECAVFCDEDGKNKGMSLNRVATRMWYYAVGQQLPDVLVGTIVIITGDKALMRAL